MAIWSKKTRGSRDRPAPPIYTGRVSGTDLSLQHISPYKSKTVDLLKMLRNTWDARNAIKLLVKEHPDMSMAVRSLIALSNQGHHIEFTDASGDRLTDAEKEWRKFSQRVYSLSDDGMDGLINQLHYSSFVLGGMAFEVAVDKSGHDIEDVYLIDPSTIQWELEERNGKSVYVPYQMTGMNKVDLSQGNFFWIPFDPDIGSPDGNLMFQSAIQAMDHQMELYQNLDTVLYRVGTPRYDISVDTARVIESAPVETKGNPQKLIEYIKNTINAIKENFSSIGVKSDFVHSDDSKITVVGGGANMSGIDARAFKEIADTEVLNATQMLGVLMNRYDSKTNALSSTEFQIMVNKIDARRRNSKRAVENIANIWLRVHGYNATATFTHNPIEWETMIDKYTAKLKEQEFYRKAEEYGWINADSAASAVMSVAKAVEKQTTRFFEYIKKLFNPDSPNSSNTDDNDDKQIKKGDKND